MHFISLALFFSLPAHAFTLVAVNSSGVTIKGWNKTKLQYVVNTSDCSVSADVMRGAVSDAVAAWNGVSTARLSMENAGDSTISTSAAIDMTDITGIPPVVCFTTAPGSADPAVTLGVSNIRYYTSSMEIVQSYVALNSVSGAAANINTLSAGELAATIAHEMGHSVGLGHSQDTTALMYFQNLRDSARLGFDDADGYTFLYPRGEAGFGGFMGCGTIALLGSKDRNDPPPPHGGVAAVSLLAFFALCFAGARLIGRTQRQSDALTSAT